MAEDFLNCGNYTLSQAAEAWAEAHGYTVEARPSGSGGGPTWGSGP
jgi:hypothetical protein